MMKPGTSRKLPIDPDYFSHFAATAASHSRMAFDADLLGGDGGYPGSNDPPEPAPVDNGLRVTRGGGAIYWVDKGLMRHIPDPGTYNNLFRDWKGVLVNNGRPIAIGSPMPTGTFLARSARNWDIYLVEGNTKRHIAAPAVMDRCYFASNKVVVLDPNYMDSLAAGDDINYT